MPWWVKFLWACSRQRKKKQQQQFTYGQTVQKNNKQFTYGQTVHLFKIKGLNHRIFTLNICLCKSQQVFMERIYGIFFNINEWKRVTSTVFTVCSTKQWKLYKFKIGTTWVWVNDDKFNIGINYPFSTFTKRDKKQPHKIRNDKKWKENAKEIPG